MKTYEELGGDATGVAIGEVLFADYDEAWVRDNPGTPRPVAWPNTDPGMGVWFFRTCYDAMFMPVQQAIDKHRGEWRTLLGLPVPPPGITPPPHSWPDAPPEYSGNMCGVRVPGVEAVPGGASDPSLVLSWFYPRYRPESREKIRAVWKAQHLLDVLLSWPDDRAFGLSPDQHVAMCLELREHGFRPCDMLLSKVYDPHHDVAGCLANVNLVLPKLLPTKIAARISIGWELCIDRWIDPEELDQLTDVIAPQCVAAGVPCYVHFQQGYAHMDHDPGGSFGGYWRRQRGKLTGLLHQRHLSWDKAEYQARLVDILDRYSGKINVGVTDNGINGQPFYCTGLEITAHNQFEEGMSEAEGNAWGQTAITTPAVTGPNGTCRIMGSGNGH